ncbi:RNA polymerase sigma factor [Alkalicoccus saliphilus]|uniref:RNA polymerase subunit sigma-70 n=1 Tax=Alkalicoccus saliphilus TaxID=200989 RepID=A0A2T4U4A5_9BACI|nr:sigma-70 family RNA polymerase sigma factor [Alkalicoccus saliphilus]PTL38237.1 RNA polymerase subunit sigma-70 [Alkalicoccus saliphilus]
MEKHEDVQLYERIRAKDEAAMEMLYDKYAKLLYSFAYKMVYNAAGAEEVVQEVMIKLWRGKGIYSEEKGKFTTWLLTITRHTAIDYLRKQKKTTEDVIHQETEHEDSQPGTEELVEWKHRGERVKEAMRTLKEEQRLIIDLFYFKGYSQKKIAEKVNVPLGTVKGRIRLALKHLKDELYEERRDWQ